MTTKITMNMSQKAIQNTETITKILQSKTRTQAIETALSIASVVLENYNHGKQILIVDKDGQTMKLIIVL